MPTLDKISIETLAALRAQLKACEEDRARLQGAIEGIELFINQIKQAEATRGPDQK